MSLSRPPRTRRAPPLTPGEWAWFIDQPLSLDETWRTPDHWTNYRLLANHDLGDASKGYAEQRWNDVKNEVLAYWVANYPGTRPKTWWRFSAPEPRRPRESERRFLERLDLWEAGERERLVEARAARELSKPP